MRTAASLLICVCGSLIGCSPEWYRQQADRESYAAIAERMMDPRWTVPPIAIEPPPPSRLHDPFPPDSPALPPDDPAAHTYMECVDVKKGWRHWHDNGDALWVEDPRWRDYLTLNSVGQLVLTPDRAVELGLLHSRQYQTQLERLYLTALALRLDRFEFDLHWFGRNRTFYEHSGTSSLPGERNTLTTASNFGFTRSLATGGQLLVDFANSFVWEYTGPNKNTVSSNIVINFLQPLLRGAGREVRLEALTQAERNTLYAVRDFARYRKDFYADITTRGDGYLSLLLQLQNIRNLEANRKSLEQNLRMHEALFDAGSVSSIQVDQAFQSFQQGRLELLQAETGLENSLDDFKTNLGLPPSIPVQLDDSLLAPFQLNDPAVTRLQEEIDKVFAAFRELDEAPPLAKLREGFNQLRGFNQRAINLADQIKDELKRWKTELDQSKSDDPQLVRDRKAHEDLTKQLDEVVQDFKELGDDIGKATSALREDQRMQGWDAVQKHAREQIGFVAQLFVIQTQARVPLIKLRPIKHELSPALDYALENRLDLMNQRARVVDAWRQITVTADALEANLDVEVNANIGTAADASNPLDFSAAGSSYRVGLRFDGPLNRKTESNIYRASLVNYQVARRTYMALEDRVQQDIRRDLRQLETERLNFEIARQSLITAARQVEASREQLLLAERSTDTSTTQDVLNALNALLRAKNTLIRSWVNYETGRIQLLLDMELLQVDERGLYSDEHNDRTLSALPAAVSPNQTGLNAIHP